MGADKQYILSTVLTYRVATYSSQLQACKTQLFWIINPLQPPLSPFKSQLHLNQRLLGITHCC